MFNRKGQNPNEKVVRMNEYFKTLEEHHRNLALPWGKVERWLIYAALENFPYSEVVKWTMGDWIAFYERIIK